MDYGQGEPLIVLQTLGLLIVMLIGWAFMIAVAVHWLRRALAKMFR
jgi:hypothetical protein